MADQETTGVTTLATAGGKENVVSLPQLLPGKKAKGKAPARSRRMTTTERAANNAASTASREITRYILRGIFGTRKR